MNAIIECGECTRRNLFTLVCGLAVTLTVGCKTQGAEDGTSSGTNATATQTIRPEDPIDESFRGCQKSCGMNAAAVSDRIVLQPEAKQGDYTRCPVSGAVFQISEGTPRREHRNRPVFLCCEGCAHYFDKHVETVVALRGL
ncbi:MAG TPA: hypothetical protein VNO21_15900 [Polyangiaceae bacterium]|nr:hypothetical protein [Polyangiaceae bacterium]